VKLVFSDGHEGIKAAVSQIFTAKDHFMHHDEATTSRQECQSRAAATSSARTLQARGVKTPRGRVEWQPVQVAA
jgi:hypothetical protein